MGRFHWVCPGAWVANGTGQDNGHGKTIAALAEVVVQISPVNEIEHGLFPAAVIVSQSGQIVSSLVEITKDNATIVSLTI